MKHLLAKLKLLIALEGHWIDWEKPRFIGDEVEWQMFVASKQGKYPELPGDVASTIQGIDAVWILKHSARCKFGVVDKIAIQSGQGG